MTQIEQIRAEIRRLDEKYRRVRVSGMSQQAKEADLVVHVLQGLSNFLDALEEPSLPSDVDEAAKEEYPDTGEASVDFKLIQRREDFKAGAEWQKSQMISALKNDGELPIEFIDKFHEIDRNAFQNGQKNVKERLLKDAVEGVMIDSLRVQIMAPLNAVIQREGLKDGDKMKILIVKEEQK